MTKRNALPSYVTSRPGMTEEYFALEITEERTNSWSHSGHYFNLKGRIVVTDASGYLITDERGYVSNSFFSEQGGEIEHVRTSCQANCDDNGNRGTPYAWEVGYDCYQGVNLETAEKAVKVLGKVKRHLDKVQSEDGSPDTYGMYLLRVCKALGVSFIRVRRPKEWTRSPYHTRDQQEWSACNLADGKDSINHLIYLWQNEIALKAEQSRRDAEERQYYQNQALIAAPSTN